MAAPVLYRGVQYVHENKTKVDQSAVSAAPSKLGRIKSR